MAVKIRLQRHGKKGKPFYWIVAADSRAKRDGKYLQKLGVYDPNTNPARVEINIQEALKWLQNGAIPTDTARTLLSYRGVMLKHHLNKGVLKGALKQEKADEKFQEWLKEKESKINAKQDKISKETDKLKAEKLKLEKEVNQKRVLERENAAKEVSAKEETAAEEPATKEEIPPDGPVAKAETPAEEPVVKEDTPAEEPAVKEDSKADDPAITEDTPTEEPLDQNETSEDYNSKQE